MDSSESPDCPLLLSCRLDYKSTANILGNFSWHVLYFLVLYRQYFTRNFFLLEVMCEGSTVLWGMNQLRRFFCSVRNNHDSSPYISTWANMFSRSLSLTFLRSLCFYVSLHVLTIPLHITLDRNIGSSTWAYRVSLYLSCLLEQASRASSYNFIKFAFWNIFC